MAFASRFQTQVVIAATQPFVHAFHKGFDSLHVAVRKNGDEVANYVPLEDVIRKHGYPTRCIMFQNLSDTAPYVQSSIAFAKFSQDEYPGRIETNFFVSARKPPDGNTIHAIQFSDGVDYKSFIASL